MSEHDSAVPAPSPFGLLVSPELALEAAKRLASANLARSTEYMDKRKGKPVDPELARFDAAVELGKL